MAASNTSRLRKSVREKMLFGVSGGLAEYFDLDPAIVRMVFVCATLFGGLGILFYVVLAVIMPAEGTGAVPGPSAPNLENMYETLEQMAEDTEQAGVNVAGHLRGLNSEQRGRRRKGLAIVFIAFGAYLLLQSLNLVWWISWSFFWALFLIAIGVFLITRWSSRPST